MARLTVAQKKAAELAAKRNWKDEDQVTVKITGTIEDNGDGDWMLYYGDNNGEELYFNEYTNGIEVEVVESADIYEAGDVIRDAEGCIFLRVENRYREKLEWKGISDDHCNNPTRPYTKAVFT